MARSEEITRVLAVSLRRIIRDAVLNFDRLEEIRLRIGAPLNVTYDSHSLFLSETGTFCTAEKAYFVTAAEVRETMDYLSSYSRYAFEEKIRQGFLTIQGGHRIGLCGRTVVEGGHVKTISPVSCLNIRIARQVEGCGRKVVVWLWENGQLQDTLIVSPPGLGKTTLLRDLIRFLSDGEGERAYTVGVVDERSELAACYQGIPQNHMGSRTDVPDGCPKDQGMMMLLRTMSPQVIAVDEVGSEADCSAMEAAMNSGCRILATAHGVSLEEIKKRPVFGRWLEERRFGRYVVIEREGERCFYRICNCEGDTLWRGERLGYEMREEISCKG